MTFDEWYDQYELINDYTFCKGDLKAAWQAGFEEGAGVGGDNKKAADDERLAKGLR